MVLYGPLSRGIVTGLVHREGIILDVVFAGGSVGWYECLFVLLANGLAELIPYDMPVPDLLVDRWVVDQGAFSLRHGPVIVMGHGVLVTHEVTLTTACQTCHPVIL